MTDPTARELRATNGQVVPLNGLELYFETSGSGRALILLHGGLQTIDLTFGPLIASLAQRHFVIGVELQGHGHSTDREGPMRLADLADDVVALLDHLAVERADVFGFSLGGLVAMTLGLEHPERIDKLVVASVDHQPGHEEFEHPEDPDMARRLPTQADFEAMRTHYQNVAPDPSRFDEIAPKTSTMVHGLSGWSDQELGSIEASTLLIVGDTDFVPLSHAVAMYEAMPHAQLAVLADTTHIGVTQRTNEMTALLDRFLSD